MSTLVIRDWETKSRPKQSMVIFVPAATIKELPKHNFPSEGRWCSFGVNCLRRDNARKATSSSALPRRASTTGVLVSFSKSQTGFTRAEQKQQVDCPSFYINLRTSDRNIVQGAHHPAVWVRIQPSVRLICGQRVLDPQVGGGS